MEHIKNTLKKLDLTDKEILVYLANLKTWTSPSSGIWYNLDFPQSTIKYTLESLTKKNLLTKSKKWITTYFTAEHPAKLKNLLIVKKNELEDTEKSIDNIMWDLIGLYNPYTKLPKVTFYEWLDWIQKVLDDSLTATEVIDSFADVDSVWKYIFNMNKKYWEDRKKLNIKKRMIIPNTEYSKEYMNNNYQDKNDKLNQFKFLNSEEYDLYISFMIYDWKVSYITMEEETYIWVIIENPQIYNFHKNMFKFIWNNSK